ncbi:hypothetical protein O3G_MSEX008145 [Manduca sexta]|uniref:THAP-type domain-containing protein n=1 Tax=Manduca sexta TaxID=7130 RepID=A0A921Z9A6_MANSE|nr:hypothetical protein O3G_MSEX008145 [Manduca sexta]
MERKNYQRCMVPHCINTSVTTPKKIFINVPRNAELRRSWLRLAGRHDASQISTSSPIYFCEDHFDLPNDMENYTQYKIMGSVKKIRMKTGCLPSKFICGTDKKRSASPSPPHVNKCRKLNVIKETDESTLVIPAVNVTTPFDVSMQASSNTLDNCSSKEKAVQRCLIAKQHKAVQAYVQTKFVRSKNTQTIFKVRDAQTSPKVCAVSIALSPFKIEKVYKERPSTSGYSKKIFIQEEKSDSDASIHAVPQCQEPSPSSSILSVLPKLSSDCSSLNEEDAKIRKENDYKLALSCTLLKIEKNPRFYIGVPEGLYFLIDLLTKHTKIQRHHILLCLKKIRLDTKFTELADEFGMSTSYASKIFLKNIPILAYFFRSFLVRLNRNNLKMNLPMAFRHHYNKVTCIIDAFEIEIQKPSKSLQQALSWSEYKKANTIKYLISSTPDGAVNFVSQGFGGRISDTLLVERSKFLEQLSSGNCVLADRGFKNIDCILSQQGCHLIRPPSVSSTLKPSK